mmetsp:Transcript_15978/g.34585  ORF Transcript_15978/g.34585 Transcript_15978/m.34585 type:complete len:222 (+) Transcript_15978:83-748(+)|eukprot:CAMPEP_0206446994 /NCGR_PEP_ID=MMETSP0324_2-20121206/16498_1 /ASSEMBLY_ACC=CAM_ASM_000836 /TAXON_ID=2866 /ORGANISM="Crypthecodinium cohnii, Strain Seligo" /LENGTH=221 /DNA_ID=CAMNT_0053915633 /DNA_START=77 /DNA_END=742 /DNA_ORIENTATION=+
MAIATRALKQLQPLCLLGSTSFLASSSAFSPALAAAAQKYHPHHIHNWQTAAVAAKRASSSTALVAPLSLFGPVAITSSSDSVAACSWSPRRTLHTSVFSRFAVRGQKFRGPVQEHIEEVLTREFQPTHLQVVNESHGKQSDESHFHVVVVSGAFENVGKLARHRMVSKHFTNDDGALKFHSLRITAQTPDAWAANSKLAAAPKCTGKGDGRGKVTDSSAL